MEFILIIIIIALVAYLLYSKKSKNNVTQPIMETPEEQEKAAEKERIYPYKKKMLLTKTEYSFYKILKIACDANELLICPKVRLEDFIEVTDKENYMKYRGYIKSRHVDFMVCDDRLHILCAIELDDKSHNTAKAQKADNFKDNLYKAIEIPLYRIKVSEGNYEKHIMNIFNEILE